MMKNFNQQYADYMESNNYVNGVIVEYVEGIEVIKAFNQSSTSYEKFANAVESFKDLHVEMVSKHLETDEFWKCGFAIHILGTLPIGLLLYYNSTLYAAGFSNLFDSVPWHCWPTYELTTYVNEMKLWSMPYMMLTSC